MAKMIALAMSSASSGCSGMRERDTLNMTCSLSHSIHFLVVVPLSLLDICSFVQSRGKLSAYETRRDALCGRKRWSEGSLEDCRQQSSR